MTSTATPTTTAQAVRLAIWLGLLTAVSELGLAGLRKFGQHLPLFRPPDIVWMTPVMTAALFAAAVLGLAAVQRIRRRDLTGRAVLAACLTLALLSGLWLFPRLHRGAAMLLALGIGIRLAGSAARFLPVADRLARRSLPALAGLVLLAAVVPLGRERLAEHRWAASRGPARSGAPNVLFIMLDTVRAMSLSLYGYARPTSPELARFAAHGVLFTRAIAPSPWTLPSHASAFTGREAHELSTDWFVPLDTAYPTLAERLRAAGYNTAAFSANVWYVSREMGLDRGFVHFEDHRRSITELALSASIPRVVREEAVRWMGREDAMPDRKSAADINHDLLRWLDRKQPGPYFAFLNYYDAHTPYLPPEPFASQFRTGRMLLAQVPKQERADAPLDSSMVQAARDAYEGSIAYLDSQLGKLFGELERRGELENTLVIVAGDHGEEFMEHGVAEHGNSLYLPSVHVPLMLVWRGKLPAGTRIDTPVTLRQLPATIMGLAGLPDSPFPGPALDLAPPGVPDSLAVPPIYNQVGHATGLPDWYPVSRGDMFAVISNGLRYIRNGDGQVELYDFDRDPDERHNLAGDSTRRAAQDSLGLLVDGIRPPASP